MMEKILGAFVAGRICLDIIPEMQALPAGGFDETFLQEHLLEGSPAALSTGGAVSNTGMALHRLGNHSLASSEPAVDSLLGRGA